MVNKGVLLSQVGDTGNAIAMFDQVVARFGDSQLPALQEQVAKAHNFRLTHHVLELYGVCPRCQTE